MGLGGVWVPSLEQISFVSSLKSMGYLSDSYSFSRRKLEEQSIFSIALLNSEGHAVTQGTKSNTKQTLQDTWGQVFHSWCVNCITCMHQTQSLVPHRSPRVFTGIVFNTIAAESCVSCSPPCVDLLLLQRCKYDK